MRVSSAVSPYLDLGLALPWHPMEATVPDRAPRRRLSREARRKQILEAAQEVFGDLGYHGATMDLIAQRSGVARSLLYLHVASLEELYVECVRVARAELDERFVAASVLNRGLPREQLRAGITAYFLFVQERGPSWEALTGAGAELAGEHGDVVRQLRFQTADSIAALFQAAVPQLDAARAGAYAHVVSGGGEQLARWWRLHPQVALATVVEDLLTVVWDGLGRIVQAPPGPALPTVDERPS